MAIDVSRLRIEVQADTARAEAALGRVGHSVDSTPKAFGMAKIAALGLGTAFGAIAVGAATMGIKTASNLQQADIGFTTMLGSGAKAKAFLNTLQTFAAATPFEFPDLVRASQRLLAMGVASKNVVPYMTSIGDAVAGLGGGPELIGQVTTAIGQMSAKGKVQSGELLQLTEAGIPALKILADQFHVSTTKMQDMVTKGLVPADKALPLLMKGLETGTKTTASFGGMMEKQSHTMAGTWSTLMDTINMGLANTLKPLVPIISAIIPAVTNRLGGAFTALAKGLKAAMGLFQTIGGGLTALGAAFQAGGSDITSSGFSGIMERIGLAARVMVDVFTGYVVPAFKAIGSAALAVVVFFVQHQNAAKALGVIVGGIMVTMAAAWVAQAAVATYNTAVTVVAWFLVATASTTSASIQTRSTAQIVVGWLAAGVQAALSGAKIVAGWVAQGVAATLSSIKTAAAWVVLNAGAIVGMAVAGAAFVAMAAGWIASGVASMAGAVVMAAAWFVALGPIGWAIAAVIALVAIIILNWNTIKTHTIQAFNATMGFIKSVWTNIKTWMGTTIAALVASVKAHWTAITSAISGAVNAAKAVITGVWNTIKGFITTTMTGIRTAITTAWTNIKTAFSTGVSNAVALVRGLPGLIMGAIGGLAGQMLGAGGRIIAALGQGIRNGLGGVTKAVGSVLSAARNLLPFSPAKEGPFSGRGWTLHSGRAISAALAQGMTDNQGMVKAAALRMAQAAVPALGGITVPGLAFGASGGPVAGPGGRMGGMGALTGGRGNVQVTMHAYNPVTEPQSVTVNKTLQRVAALGLVN